MALAPQQKLFYFLTKIKYLNFEQVSVEFLERILAAG
jgi:hypothetical protein